MRLLTFFERRKLGDLQSRFGPPGTLMVTFTTSVVRGIMDRVIVVWGGGYDAVIRRISYLDD